MTESGKTEQEQLDNKGTHSFGERLFAEREKQGLSITEIAKAIHLSEDIIDALERSDVDRLPQPTFVQGYLRTYAKHLGTPEGPILEEYSNAVPHPLETDLHPRSMLPEETDSGSPFIKLVTIVLFSLIFLAAAYGLYSYYSKIVDTRNDAEESANLMLPQSDALIDNEEIEISGPLAGGQHVPEAQDNDQNITTESLSKAVETGEELIVEEQETAGEKQVSALSSREVLPEAIVDNTPRNGLINTQPIAAGEDSLELKAGEDSWTEVVDANNVTLLYDLVQQGRTVVLRGTAPFDIFLGNAPAMEVRVNSIKIDMTKFVRSNKIAHFNVSTSDKQVVFH